MGVGEKASEHRLAARDDPPAQALGLGLRGPAALRRRSSRRWPPGRWPTSGSRSARSRRRWRLEQLELAPPRVARARRARGDLRERRPRARVAMPWASPTRTSCAAFAGALTIPRTSSRARARRPSSSGCSSGARSERVAAIPYGGGTSVVGGVTPDVAPSYNGAISIDLRSARSRARGRSRLARGAHPGRRLGPGPRSPARRAFADAAPFPPVVRVLHARGLDRDACGRPFRDGVDAHRGLRGVRPRDHARRACGRREGCRDRARG